jgi:Spy/CpxP family protein refolding chaperone
MKLKRSLAIIAATGVLSLSTAIAQSNTPPGTPTRPPGRRGQAAIAESRLAAMEHALGETNKLTEAQKPKVKAVFEEQGKKLQELRGQLPDQTQSKRRAIADETNKKLKEILTPEQFKAFEAAPRGRGGPRAPRTERQAGQGSAKAGAGQQ